MADHTKENDIKKVLLVVLSELLEHHDFAKITVADLCKQAQINRAVFYVNFDDKYELLKYWLIHFSSESINKEYLQEQTAEEIKLFIDKSKKMFQNVMYKADCKTLEIIADYICSIILDSGKTI